MNKPLWLVIWILCIEILVVLVFVPGDVSVSVIKKEAEMIDGMMGVESKNWIHLKAQRWYQSLILDSGFYKELHHLFIPTPEQREASLGMKDFAFKYFVWIEGRIEAFMNMIYQVMTRIALFTLWLPYMFIILLPALFDGYMTWKLKCTNFAYVSPVLHQISIRGSLLIVGIICISFFLPIVVPPFIMPIMMIIVCLLTGTMLSNMQKRF